MAEQAWPVQPSHPWVLVPGGRFIVGCDDEYPEERPARRAVVDDFELSAHPITVGQFAIFVRETGHRTDAEVAGSAPVFVPPPGEVDLAEPSRWWAIIEGADWLAPFGPGSTAIADHPVTQVTAQDAAAYCAWANVRLPTQVEWERAASFVERPPTWPLDIDGRLLANVFIGRFPWRSDRPGRPGPLPVGRFGADPLGCVDLLGNVWEITASDWGDGRRVIKGGSFLCSADYCARYRPSARLPRTVDEPACHVGFRVARKS